MRISREKAAVGTGLAMVTLCLGLLAPPVSASPAVAEGWAAVSGTHFLVHVENGDRFLGRRVLRDAEGYYDRIAAALGYVNRDAWLEQNRCEIYLYRDKGSYLAQTGFPAWSNAATRTRPAKSIHSFFGADTFLIQELPHEIAHLVFRDYVGVDNARVPLWLDEGVALHQEGSARGGLLDRMLAEQADRGQLIPVAELIRVSEGQALAAWGSPGTSVSLFYAQSYGLVKFLLQRNGRARFVEFLRGLRDGEAVESALRKNYGDSLRDFQALEEEWQRSLQFARSV